MTDMVGFSAKEARRELTQRRRAEILLAIEGGSFENLEAAQKNLTKSQTERYCYRPFDLRWIYDEMHASLLDRPREDYWRARTSSYISMISAQSNRKAYDPPCITRSLASLHVVEKGSTVFPLEIFEESLFDAEKPDRTYDNISDSSIARYPSGTDPHDIFFHSLAIMHSTQYRIENAGALLGDWPRIPLPATADLLNIRKPRPSPRRTSRRRIQHQPRRRMVLPCRPETPARSEPRRSTQAHCRLGS